MIMTIFPTVYKRALCFENHFKYGILVMETMEPHFHTYRVITLREALAKTQKK